MLDPIGSVTPGNTQFGVDTGAAGRRNLPPVTRYPSWIDGLYLTHVGKLIPLPIITLTANVVGKIEGNAQRFALAIIAATTNAQAVLVAALPNVATFPLAQIAAGLSLWLPLSVFTLVATQELYVVSSANAQLQVYSLELNSG